MAYQPIQLPGNMGVNAGLAGLTENLRDFADWQRQKDLHRIAMLKAKSAEERQQLLDQRAHQESYQKSYLEARKLAQAGDMAGAEAIMRPFGQAQQQQVQYQRQRGPEQAQTMFEGTPDATQMSGQDWDEIGQHMGVSPTYQAQKQILTGQGPGGQAWTLDPTAMREHQLEQEEQSRQRNLATFNQQLGQIQDPRMRGYATELQPFVGMSPDQIKPEALMGYVRSRVNEDADAAARAQERETQRAWQEEQKRLDREARRENAHIMARLAAKKVDDRPLTTPERQASAVAGAMQTLIRDMESMPPLSDEGAQIIIQDAANAEALEKNPLLNAIGTKIGLVRRLEEKLSDSDKAAYAPVREFVNKVNRKETGAASSAAEWKNAFDRLLERPGDSDQLKAWKRKNRQDIVNAIAAESRAGVVDPAKGPIPDRPSAVPPKKRPPIDYAGIAARVTGQTPPASSRR